MISILDFFVKKEVKQKDNDLFATPTSERCREKILEEFGDRECGGTIFKRVDGTKFCGRCNCPFVPSEKLPP